MIKAGIDHDALIGTFSHASAKQGEALRQTVQEATLKALQGRELTLDNIKKVLKSVTQATSAGAAQNVSSPLDVETMLQKAVAGMDAALLQAVEANRRALQQFVAQGNDLSEKPLKSALDNLEKMESVFFATVTQAVKSATSPLQGPWEHVLGAMKTRGTETGVQATQTVEDLMGQAQAALRDTRATGAKAAQAMIDSYSALVSGVLIGMSEGLRSGAPTAGPPAAPASPPSASAGRRSSR